MKKNYLIIGVVSILILTVSVSLGYWMAYIEGNGAPIDLTAQDLKIVFDDNGNIEANNIEPGWTYKKTFSVTSKTNETYEYKIIIKDLINTFKTDYLKYKITSSHGYTMDKFEVLPKSETAKKISLTGNIKIEPSEVQEYTIEFIYETTTEDQSEDMGATLSGTLFIGEGDKPFLAQDLFTTKYTSEELSKKRSDFSTIVTEGSVYTEDGNYTEGSKPVYYFAGNVEDNWVYFANYYWRIIRSDEDGGLRLLYAGESPESETAYIMNSGNIESDGYLAYNENAYYNPAYVGYMYSKGSSLSAIRENEESSLIKTELETWYTSNLQSYDKYISKTAIYCNDRSTQEGWSSSGEMNYNGETKFWENDLDNTKNHPSFKCGVNGSGSLNSDSSDVERKKDMFSVSGTSGGNGKLTKPIGLITADEIVFAGGFRATDNPDAYYYRNASGGSSTGDEWWWTMSPFRFNGYYPYMFGVGGSSDAGYLGNDGLWDSSGVVRPVISLQGCVTMQGSGTADDPYKVIKECPLTAGSLGETKYASAGKRSSFDSTVTAGNVYTEDSNYTENGNKVWYWAGNTEDNWVYFANKYWRIIRTNEDGGLRLLYAGSSPTAEDAYISTMAYNPTYNNTTYVGYMYSTGSSLSAIRGNGTSSPIKSTLDNWYTSDLQSYDKYISKTAIYCNDRSTQDGWSSSGTMYYNGRTKFYTNKSDNSKNHPSFKCGVNGSGSLNTDSPDAERKKDMFSVSGASGGNGALTKPIGLITADEIVFAGGFYGTNNPDAYYYRNSSGGSSTGTNWWWTMSPYGFDGSSSVAYVFHVIGSSDAGQLNSDIVSNASGVVRPVISLKSCVQLKGSGTTDSPYEVVEFGDSDSCAVAEN